jgi:hypothetical protein
LLFVRIRASLRVRLQGENSDAPRESCRSIIHTEKVKERVVETSTGAIVCTSSCKNAFVSPAQPAIENFDYLLSVIESNSAGSNTSEERDLPVVEPGHGACLPSGARIRFQRIIDLTDGQHFVCQRFTIDYAHVEFCKHNGDEPGPQESEREHGDR